MSFDIKNIIIGVVIILVAALCLFFWNSILNVAKNIFSRTPSLNVDITSNITRSNKFYYDNMQKEDQIFHVKIMNSDRYAFLTDLQLEFFFPGSIKHASKPYFSRAAKDIRIQKHPDKNIPTAQKRIVLPSTSILLECSELAPNGIIEFSIICHCTLNKMPKVEKAKVSIEPLQTRLEGLYSMSLT